MPNVDGILLEAGRLWAVQNASNQIAELQLSADLSSATVVKVITDEAFQTPTTVARWGNRLAAVNAKFDTGFPPRRRRSRWSLSGGKGGDGPRGDNGGPHRRLPCDPLRSAAARLIPLASLIVAACGSTATPPPYSYASAAPPTTAAPAASVGATPAVSPSVEPSAAPSAGATGSIDPTSFVAAIDNPWFPLKPGTTYTYRGIKDGEKAVDTFAVTSETKVVAGVTCVVVRDELTLAGTLAEKTEDWYVQDRQGNVWYFGEATAELDDAGKIVSTEGSWQSGVDGARPGIFMPADPVLGYSGTQEFYPGQAEDRFVVLLIDQTVKVPAGSYSGVLVTAEWTPLEPSVLSEKAYAKGIGEIREADVAGGDEKFELVKVAGL